MKLKRKTKLAWGLFDEKGECVDTAESRRQAYADAKAAPGDLRVHRVRLTVTPVSA